jgi:hypothetical protein
LRAGVLSDQLKVAVVAVTELVGLLMTGFELSVMVVEADLVGS